MPNYKVRDNSENQVKNIAVDNGANFFRSAYIHGTRSVTSAVRLALLVVGLELSDTLVLLELGDPRVQRRLSRPASGDRGVQCSNLQVEGA